MPAQNTWLLTLIEAADRRGFLVLEVSSRIPGFVVLRDGWANEIRINQPTVGTDIHSYIDQLTPLDLDPASLAARKESPRAR